MNKILIEQQLEVCSKHEASFLESLANFKIGIALNVKEGIQPVNGLRHPPEGDTTGWYIWAGTEFSEDADFFVPLHVKHLEEWCPQVLKYLGLAPGWRFLINSTGYEDVWYDEQLLDI